MKKEKGSFNRQFHDGVIREEAIVKAGGAEQLEGACRRRAVIIGGKRPNEFYFFPKVSIGGEETSDHTEGVSRNHDIDEVN